MKKFSVSLVTLLLIAVGAFIGIRLKDREVRQLKAKLAVAVEPPKIIEVTREKIKYIPAEPSKAVIVKKVPEATVEINTGRFRDLILGYNAMLEEIPAGISPDDSIALFEKRKEMAAKLANPEEYVTIKNKGFIFNPQVGLCYFDEIQIAGGVKFVFIGKWNAGIYASKEGIGIGVGRHIDDLVPIFKNTELKLFPVGFFSKNFRIGILLSLDL